MYSIKRILIVTQLILLILVSVFAAQSAGEVDVSFNGAAYGELSNQGNVNVVKFQPDGKILIGGQFTEVQGYAASGLARLNADGTVDTTFNTPDFSSINSNTGASTFGGDIYAIAVQPDGKILVGGSIYIGTFDQNGVRMGIKRLNADGSVDSTFFIEQMIFGSAIYDIKLQADGKILLGGLFTLASSSSTKNLARLNADGTRDTTFSADTAGAQIKEFEIQTDGKIVAGGFSASGTPSVTMPFVRRFNTDGSADSSFTSITSGNDTIEAVKLQADGKILVAGNYTTLNGVSQGRISRLNADGMRDLNFNPGNGANAVVNDIAVRTDGKIIIGGGFSSFNGTPMQRIARLNADGSLDNTFINSGTITDTPVNDVELLPDNRILAGLSTSTLVNPLLRFSADGAFDSSFVVKVNRGGTVNKILQQPDGKILAAGEFLYANGVVRRSLARFNADGTLDTSFVPYFNNFPVLQIINAIAPQPDGKIIVGTSNGIVLQRLNPDGSQDTSFNSSLPSSSNVFDVLVQADGKILVGGLLTFILPKFARFNSDGSRDTTFNPGQPNNYLRKILIQPDGKLLIGGVFTQISDIAIRNGVARYNADGVLDNTFNPPSSTPSVSDMDLQADGKVVLVGTGIHRLNADGTLDTSLNISANAEVSAVKIQTDGKILIGGGFTLIGSAARNGIARLKLNGALDTGFRTFSNKSVNDIQLQPDGKILIGGGFSKINGVPHGRLARLLNTSVPESTLFDYDGDGRADVSVFRASENKWYVLRSSDSQVAQQIFAIAGDVPVPADYDGDGKTDFAIFRPSSGDWWYLASSNSQQVFAHLGAAGDIPRPSDFDGDGRADYVLFRPSNNVWYRISISNGAASNVQFGLSGDKPVSGDFDGDGKSDLAIYRPSSGDWWWQSSVDNVQRATHWGISTDVPTPADYDGDGKTDFAVYRPSTGTWYIYNSGNNSSTILNFGISEDKPVPADYDGDGKADIAVFRPSTGVWYQQKTTAGFAAIQFGVSSDTPTENSFVP
jgi:uncharacterized delta-60 repeat protein